MIKPQPQPLTDFPRTKSVVKIPLEAGNHYPTFDEILNWYKQTSHEDHNENNSQSISELESYETD